MDGGVDISRILLLVCLLKKGDAPVGVVRRAGALFFLVVLSCSCSCRIILTELLPLNRNCSLFTGHLCLITGGGYSWTLMSN